MIITADTKSQMSYADAMVEVAVSTTEYMAISDSAAVTIAAAWASPQSSLATLATTGKVNVSRLLADIEREELSLTPGSTDYSEDADALAALRDWAAVKRDSGL